MSRKKILFELLIFQMPFMVILEVPDLNLFLVRFEVPLDVVLLTFRNFHCTNNAANGVVYRTDKILQVPL